MRQFIFFLLMSVLVQATAQGQNEGIPLGKAKAFRLRLGLGVSLSSTTKQLKSHLEKNGFGSNYHNSGFIFDGEVKYPQTTNMPLVVEVTLERQLNKSGWVGLSIGSGNRTSAKGFRYTGSTNIPILGINIAQGQSVTMWHSSWYLSPQYTSYVPESNFGFFGGPILNFHALKLEWENESAQKKRPVNIGAMLGLRVNTTGRWEWFVAYHWSPRLQYDSSSTTKVNGSNTRTFSLPSVEIGFSCLKTGFSYYFPFSGKK